jgi:hypothetical protein
MRRTGIALISLATLVIAAASSGSGAFAIDPGVFSSSPNSADFGNVGLGAPPQTITETLTNMGSSTVNMQGDSLTGSGDFNITADSCNNSAIDPNNSCSIDVTLAPTSTGNESGQLVITDDDPSSPQHIDLNGNGVTQFSLSGPLDFGNQQVSTTSGDQTEIVTNNTDYNGNPSGPSISGSNSGDFNLDGTDCTGSLLGGATCTVNVNFLPTSTGSRSATLNAGGQSVSLTGTGTEANASLTPGSVSFGSQPVATTSGTATLTLKNNGTAPLNYGSVAKGGANPGDFAVGDSNCAAAGSLAPNASCSITAGFVPTATGTRTATVVVHDSDPQNPTQTVTLSGKGTPSSVGFAPTSVTFVTPIPAGTASPVHGVTVTNTTNSNMPITGIALAGANSKNFIRSADTCTGKTLAPNGKCTIHIEFAPTGAGLRTALLQVNDNGPIAPHSHQLTLTGTATYPHDPKLVRGTVGCGASQITWVSPTATRFAGTIVVRNHAHSPTGPGDGAVVQHQAGIARDKGLKHFTTYFYRVFARYHSLTRPTQVNYSAGARLKETTGEICTPQNGARLRDLTPTFTWLPSATKNGYAFVLQHSGETIWINYTHKARWHMPGSWRYHKSTHRLAHERSYTFYLYAYPSSHPKGILIGKVSFSER